VNRTRSRPELVIIAVAVTVAVVCIVLIGRRWADRERTRRPELDPLPSPIEVPPPGTVPPQSEPHLSASVPLPNTFVYALAFTPDGARLAVAGSAQDRKLRDQPVVRVCDADDGRELMSLHQPDEVGRYVAVAVSPDGKAVAAVGVVVADGKSVGNVCVWDLESRKSRWTARPAAFVNCVAWSPDGTRLAAGDKGGTISVWAADGAPQGTWPAHKADKTPGVGCLAWSNDGKRIASVVGDTIRIWTAADHREAKSVTVPEQSSATALAFAPDDLELFVSGWRAGRGGIWVWDLVSNHESRSLTAHETPVGGFALGPGARSIFTATNEAITPPHWALTVRGWDAAANRELWLITMPTDQAQVAPFAVSRDGRRMALADMARTNTETAWAVNLYELPPPP
jgi:WD40 repeat protein